MEIEEAVCQDILKYMDWIWDILDRARAEQATLEDMQRARRYADMLDDLLVLHKKYSCTAISRSTEWLAKELSFAVGVFEDRFKRNKFYV